MMNIFKLIKPGIIFGNLISASGGFFLASRGRWSKFLFLKIILGMTFIVASSCILNNIIDKDIDKKMNRTKNRILCINKSVKLLKCLILFSLLLFFFGFFIFYLYINKLSAMISLLGEFVYVILYSFCFKRKSGASIIIGGIAGSLPPIIGFISVSNKLNSCCIILFFIFMFWQVSHSYSIILYRYQDYKMLNIPNFPILYGIIYTQYCISLCIIGLFFSNFFLYYFSYLNFFYFYLTSVFIIFWLVFSITGIYLFCSYKIWSRIMFFFSIFIIFLMSLLMSFNFV